MTEHLHEDDNYAYVAAQSEASGYMRGWNEALNKAREAIKAEFMQEGKLFNCYYECTDEALAAIDALKDDR